MIRSVFESAVVVHPEMHSPMSRAMYGVDVMLDCHFRPKLLEVWKIKQPFCIQYIFLILFSFLEYMIFGVSRIDTVGSCGRNRNPQIVPIA